MPWGASPFFACESNAFQLTARLCEAGKARLRRCRPRAEARTMNFTFPGEVCISLTNCSSPLPLVVITFGAIVIIVGNPTALVADGFVVSLPRIEQAIVGRRAC